MAPVFDTILELWDDKETLQQYLFSITITSPGPSSWAPAASERASPGLSSTDSATPSHLQTGINLLSGVIESLIKVQDNLRQLQENLESDHYVSQGVASWSKIVFGTIGLTGFIATAIAAPFLFVLATPLWISSYGLLVAGGLTSLLAIINGAKQVTTVF